MKQASMRDTLVAFFMVCVAGCVSTGTDSVGKPIMVTVNLHSKHQAIDNFGASDCWSMQKIGAWSESNRNRVADLLFSETEGIGLSCWRFNLGGGLDLEHMGGPDSWRTVDTFQVADGEYDWTRQAEEQWFLRAAQARGVEQFIAFCNSPPRLLTRNGHTFSSGHEGTTNLKEGAEPAFARYLADILQHFAQHPDPAHRIEFDWISPINEPQWAWVGGGQEGCRASNDDLKAIILALHEELRGRGLDTGILAPESGNIYGMHAEHIDAKTRHGAKYGDYFDDLCGDPAIADKLGGVICAHSYGFDTIPGLLVPQRVEFRKKLDEFPGWRYWMTEYCVMQGPEGHGGHGRDLGMKTALDVARVIHYDLTICRASAWQWWTAVSPCDYKDGLIYTDYQKDGDAETIYPAKLLWTLGNFSRFIRPGSTRIELVGADNETGVMGSAYLNPNRDTIILVFVNASESPEPVSISVAGLPAGTAVETFAPHVTSDTHDLAPLPSVPAGTDYTIPARSVVTLVGNIEPAG